MKTSRGTLAALFALCVVTAAVAGCSSSGSGKSGASSTGASTKSGSSKPFQLLAIVGTTGPTASFGQASVAGLKAGIDTVNAAGGIGGRTVKLKVLDDGGTAPQAVTQLQSALSSGTKYDALWTVTSTEATALAPVADKAKLFMSSAATTDELKSPTKYPRFLGIVGGSATAQSALVDRMISQGYKRIGIIATSDAYGIASSGAAKTVAQQKNLEVKVATVDPNVVDATPAMQQVQSSKPDVLVLDTSTFGAGVAALKARTKLGISTPTYGDQLFSSYPIASATSASDWRGVFVQGQSFQIAGSASTKTAAYTTFRAALGKYAKSPLPVSIPVYAHTYDVPIFLAAAVAKSGSDDPAGIVKGARQLAKGQDVKNFVAQTTLWTDPNSTFPNLSSADYVYAPLGPTVDGLLQPGQ